MSMGWIQAWYIQIRIHFLSEWMCSPFLNLTWVVYVDIWIHSKLKTSKSDITHKQVMLFSQNTHTTCTSPCT